MWVSVGTVPSLWSGNTTGRERTVTRSLAQGPSQSQGTGPALCSSETLKDATLLGILLSLGTQKIDFCNNLSQWYRYMFSLVSGVQSSSD